ncbi:MAG: outer membrane protein assembly factor BamC [Marinobacter sp.]|uniref:outer membrane protein assembly factor BamC n=1 Tax=Marinobacter sp. TaxID=50741 RepID=UPI00299E3111|nr:outer membrane protein assembly factor BamC [Marinobacter sp.]MDX1633078.1 outer membrane protein assembly factor BamC [Marinobacter sp.]
MDLLYRKLLAGVVSCVWLLAASGCSLIDDRTENYVNAPAGDPLKTPDGEPLPRAREAYPIRNLDGATSGGLMPSDIPRPPDMTSEILEENYLVENLGDQTWVLVNEVPGRVWPSVSAFMNERGLGVAYESTQLGILQSEVANYSQRARQLLEMPESGEAEASTVVQARVAPGIRRKTTEVQFRVRRLDQAPDQLLTWPSQSDAPELERKLLESLAVFLKEREDNKSYSRAALRMSNAPKVRLQSGGEQAAGIEMTVPYDRAWAEVRRALDEARIPVVDLDRSEGRFYVDFRTEDEREPGWFSWFTDAPEPIYSFHVRLEETNEGVFVTTGKAPDYQGADRSQRLLSELFEYLY